MRRLFFSLIAVFLFTGPALADQVQLVKKASIYSVSDVLDRLEAIVRSKGATVFARIDHAAGAQKTGATLRPTALLIFGNPKLGTPLMQRAQTAGLDLPMKVLAYQDAAGKVWLTYANPKAMGASHGLAMDAPETVKISNVLNKLTNAALKP